LQQELAAVRSQGYATDDEEYELGMRGIAAPIRDDTGRSVAAVGVAGPTQRLSRTQLLDFAGAVGEAAAAISLRLGNRANTPFAP
jgi:IclR family KDG regulon transcriptional repressor